MYKICSIFACVGLLSIPSSLQARDCSCTAPDGSCSASIKCPSSCIAACRPNGNCAAECIGGSPVGPEAQAVERSGDGLLGRKVDLDLNSVTAADLAAELSSQFGVEIEIEPREQVLSVQFENISLRRVVEVLSRYGTVRISGESPGGGEVSQASFLHHNVSIAAESADAQTLSYMLTRALGRPVTFVPHDPEQVISIDLQNVPASTMVEVLARYGRVVIPDVPREQ